jgi:hypothetical protein
VLVGGRFNVSKSDLLLLLLLLGGAVVLGLLITGIVYAGATRRSRRYRPGRPFPFTPVWFLAAPERQIIAATSGQRELPVASPASRRAGHVAESTTLASRSAFESTRVGRGETGGASDHW